MAGKVHCSRRARVCYQRKCAGVRSAPGSSSYGASGDRTITTSAPPCATCRATPATKTSAPHAATTTHGRELTGRPVPGEPCLRAGELACCQAGPASNSAARSSSGPRAGRRRPRSAAAPGRRPRGPRPSWPSDRCWPGGPAGRSAAGQPEAARNRGSARSASASSSASRARSSSPGRGA